MEQPTSPLSHKGSISEAITEALTHKKLFVVFISGDDDSSKRLEQSTLVDEKVVESVRKYCVFLHLHSGTADASQFSAIYPQKSIPSISVVGYNGVMMFQHEGFITADSFLESVKKAWESIQLQETTAALLTAALASKNLESLTPSNLDSQEKRNSSTGDAPSTSGGKPDQEPDEKNSSNYATVEDDNSRVAPSTSGGKPYQEPDEKNSSNDATVEDDNSRVSTSVHVEETHPSDSNSKVVNTSSEIEKKENFFPAGSSKTPSPVQLTDVHLSIRLPNGSRLQFSSPLTDTLQSVKKYVLENAASNVGAFDLAIPYPRKIFTDQDMNRPLSDLGFSSREALIVVPHKHADVAPINPRGSFKSEHHQRDNEGGGYFALLKRILSFVNPLSYIGGASQTSAPVQTPSSAFQGNPYRDEGFLRTHASNEQNPSAGSSSGATRSQVPARFGGNIHTLRDVEQEDPSSDRNLFWNGNSTEFGGDDRR